MPLRKLFGPNIQSTNGGHQNVVLDIYPYDFKHKNIGNILFLFPLCNNIDDRYYCIFWEIDEKNSHSYSIGELDNLCYSCNYKWENEGHKYYFGPDWDCDNNQCTISYNYIKIYGLYKVDNNMYKMSSALYYDIIESDYSISSFMQIHYKDGDKYYAEYDNNNSAKFYVNEDNTLMMFKIIYIPIKIENNNVVLFSSEDDFRSGILHTKHSFKDKMNEIKYLSNLSERKLTTFMDLSLHKQQLFMWWSPPDKKGYRDSKSRRKLLFIVMMCAYKASEESKLLSLRLKQEETYSHVTQKYPSTVGIFVPVTEQYLNMFIGGLDILPPEIWNKIFSFSKHEIMPLPLPIK